MIGIDSGFGLSYLLLALGLTFIWIIATAPQEQEFRARRNARDLEMRS